MKCFNCGKKTEQYLCNNCHTEEILDKIYNEILSFKNEESKNKYIKEYVENLEDEHDLKNCIPDILETFDENVTDYYYCHYLKITKNSKFEEMAVHYMNSRKSMNDKKQRILYDLLHYYNRVVYNYRKPKKWCDLILNSNQNIAIEIYALVAEYYSRVVEFSASEKIIEIARKKMKNNPIYIFSNEDNMKKSFDNVERVLVRYKTGLLYWPKTEERQKAILEIYEERGIKYVRESTGLKATKIKESEFKPIKEVYDDLPEKYICFWCSATYNTKTIQSIYQVGAVKVSKGKIIDKYQSFIKPWDGIKAKERAAEAANVKIEEIESARSVKIVMKEFMEWIHDELLVSTEALGNQSKLLTRALRYSGINEINNGFFDILDYAADIDSKFDLENNSREYLLKYFKIEEGKDSVEKANVNFKLLCKLKEREK